MRAIIIGAGRGRRLMPTTADTPKCFAEVQGKRLLDWTLKAFSENGIDDICFIGGYRIDRVRADYPHFTFRENADWENNNILLSLMYAEDLMGEPFICTYSDTLFTADVVKRLLANPADIALSVDTDWLARYEHRTEHPPTDAEKVTVANGLVTEIHRDIDPSAGPRRIHRRREIHPARRRGAEGALSSLPAGLCRQAVPRGGGLRKGLSHPPVSGHDRGRDEDGACRYARQLHRGGHAAGFRVRAKLLAWLDMARQLFPASVVGSMPRPAFVQDLINDRPPLPPDRYQAEMDAAVRYIVAMQEHAGLDVVTDGEWRRKSYIGVIAELAHGFELGYNPADNRPWTIVVDKLAPKKPGFIAREIAFLKTITSRKIKATAAGARAARRTHVGSGEIDQGLSGSRGFRARLRADPAARDGADPRGRRRHHPDRRSASVPVRRSGGSQPVSTMPMRRPISRWTWSMP